MNVNGPLSNTTASSLITISTDAYGKSETSTLLDGKKEPLICILLLKESINASTGNCEIKVDAISDIYIYMTVLQYERQRWFNCLRSLGS